MLVPVGFVGLWVMVVVWSVDTYLFLAIARVVLSAVEQGKASRACRALAPFTDWFPIHVQRWLSTVAHRPIPVWSSWAIVLIAIIALRILLVQLAMTL